MFTTNYLNDLAIFDIETIAGHSSYEELYRTNSRLCMLWDKLAKQKGYVTDDSNSEEINEAYLCNAGLHPEFGKILSISFCFIKDEKITVKNLFNINEKELLTKAQEYFTLLCKPRSYTLCGHNVLNFDIPFLSKRFLINGFLLPDILNFTNKKPWEINILDTMKYWNFTHNGFNNNISLDLLCTSMGVTSPKLIMTDTSVHELFINNEFDKVIEYNNGDVKCIAELLIQISKYQ